jgi:transcriptional antiterminator NusG
MLAQMKEREEKVKPKVSFEVGETVKVADGPFQNQTGVVEEIDPERGKLRVSVTIFGRATPVELEYWQVERGIIVRAVIPSKVEESLDLN